MCIWSGEEITLTLTLNNTYGANIEPMASPNLVQMA